MAFDRSHVDVEDYLECLGLRNVSKATEAEWRFSCPYPNHMNGDENASAYINDKRGAFFCHGCKKKGDVVSLAAFVLEVSHMEAVRMLRERYQPGYLNPDARSMKSEVRAILEGETDERPQNFTFDASALDEMDVDWPKVQKFPRFAPEPFRYLLDRGFTAETLESWRFGYHAGTDRITFPVHDESGGLVGVKGRVWEAGREPKYLVLGDVPNKPQRYGFPRYQTGLVVFGSDRAIAAEHKSVIICEGELNAIALHQAGFTNAVAVNGSNFTEAQKNIIVRHFDHAIVCFDSDPAGEEGTWGKVDGDDGEFKPGVVDKLEKYITVAVVEDHDDDPAKMVEKGETQALADLIEGAKSATLIKIAAHLELR